MTIVVLVEPEGRPMRLDATPRRMWRTVDISPSCEVGIATDCYESHVATCKGINREG